MSLPPDFVADLRKHFSGDIAQDLASKVLYSTDASIYQIEPLGVAVPRTQDDLQAAVELAAKHHVPVLARGAGSSLAGQAIGEALVLDCSRWLDKIVQIDTDAHLAVVEPGVVLSTLNREAARHGLQFGPDPASAERATMGGVIANNATGAHSIIYGMTADHLLSATVVLADGSLATLGEIHEQMAQSPGSAQRAPSEDQVGLAKSTRYAAILEAALAIRRHHADAIKAQFPRTWRNSAGYRLNYLLAWSPSVPPAWSGDEYPPCGGPGAFNLAQLLAGSEGTLAVISRATVNLVPKPKCSMLGILAYSSIDRACDAVPQLLERHPSAVELIPSLIWRLARDVPGYAHLLGWLKGDPAAVLVVEFSGERNEALRESVAGLGTDVVVAESASEQASVWALRRAGLGILDSRPGSARPAAFIEDCAIPVERLGDFVREVQGIMAAHKAEGGIYGHASAGCLHIRPVLDLKTAEGVAALRDIAEQTLAVALRVGGSMSSEHGDGIARGEWLRRTYGEEIGKAMSLIKKAADPEELLNPRKMMDSPSMDSHLRYGVGYLARAWKPRLDFARNGGFTTAIEQCNGQAVCRQDTATMCPSFQATRMEMHSTRGRANLLRALITSRGSHPGAPAWRDAAAPKGGPADVRSRVMVNAVYEALDLCLACKACRAECPSGVDMAKLKAGFLEEFYRFRPRSIRDYLFGYFHVTARVLSVIAPFVNAATGIPGIRQGLARAMGIAPARPFPKIASRLARPPEKHGRAPVLLLRDPYSHYVEPAVEQAAFDLLSAGGFEVHVLDAMGAGAALVAKGFLKAARQHAEGLMQELGRRDPDASLPIVAIEPSELSTLKHDYADLLPTLAPATGRLRSKARSVEGLLVESGALGDLRIAKSHSRILFHPHCHEKADNPGIDDDFRVLYPGMELLREFGYEGELIDAGCCGMAGTFGYEAEHYRLSQEIGALKLFPKIKASNVTGVAATGAACRMQIAQATGASVEHPLVWAARALQSQ